MLLKAIAVIAGFTALVLALFGSARADGLYARCSFERHAYTCITAEVGGADPRIIEREPVMDREWRAFCKPQVFVDELGAEHLTYAHKGCEYGRTK